MLADEFFERLADNMDGAHEQMEAALCYLCALIRDPSRSFNADDFWPNVVKFAREERKRTAGCLPVWLPFLLETLATAVRDRASQAPGQSLADTNRILKAAIPPSVKGRRPEFVAVEAAIRPAYPAGATIGRRARMVGATWALRMALHIADHVREEGQPATPEGASYADIAAVYDIPPATLTRCLLLAAEGTAGDPPPAAAAADPTRKNRLSPDLNFMGWAHIKKAINEQHGVAWMGSGLKAVQVAASCYAYAENLTEGVIRSTCLVKAHGAKEQGLGTLCEGCRLGKGCTERYVYAKGGIALSQGHIAGCETQVLVVTSAVFASDPWGAVMGTGSASPAPIGVVGTGCLLDVGR